MGLILIPADLKEQADILDTARKKINDGFENVKNEVARFAYDNTQRGQTWEKLREKLLEYHDYIQRGMYAVQDSIDRDISVLNNSVGDEELYEDQLLDIIEKMKIEIVRIQNMIDMLQAREDEFSEDWRTKVRRRIAELEQQLKHTEYMRDIYIEKLKMLYAIEDSTKTLFHSGIELLTALSALISEAGVKIMSGNADVTLPGVDCEKWIKVILNNVNNNEQQGIEKKLEFSGYLSYGADDLTNESSEGFFKLYDEPTLSSKCEIIDINSLYRDYGIEPHGALQSFGGTAGLNKTGNIQYGNQKFDPEKGTLIYNGIERYAIAMGPKLQNPDVDCELGFQANDMAYGTCVDVSIELNNHTYYIPAIIVDCKAHSAPTGIFQTGKAFNKGGIVNTGTEGPIIEWYTPQYMNGDKDKNKSAGLSKFNGNSQLIFYRDEVLK